jgi:hypothetical protein
MSNQFLKLRRSAVAGRVPGTASLDFGEIALNTHDGLMFMKKLGDSGIEEVIAIGSNTGGSSNIFVNNETPSAATSTITATQALYNPSNLSIFASSTFVIQETAEYYVLGDVRNSGSLQVNGTMKIGGGLYGSGTVTGTGIIE